ncbi:MAG: hypothetical protein PHX13_10550 [Thiovulaceae bacterium]|nr:hypothetical protein [Sulfurimonadaceae bacterium]
MVALFGMIVEGFGWFMAFFGRIAVFFTSEAVATNLRFAIRLTLLNAFRVSFLFFITLLFAFIAFALDALVKIYNLISNVIHMMQDPSLSVGSGASSPIIQGFFYFLHVSGISDAIATVFPIIASALTFVLTRNAYRVTLYFYKQITWVYSTAVTLITGA